MKRLRRGLPTVALLLLLLAAWGWAPTGAQSPPEPADLPSLEDRVALEAYVDGLMAAHMAQYHIPGAVVSVVHQGEIVLAKGYGYRDLATFAPVDAETTLFRIGSVSKLFVWTAVMQLVESGLLDLDADLNIYLTRSAVEILPTFLSTPITMRHLMAHTPGFEDRNLGLFARDESALLPLETLLLDQPVRVRPPGQVSAYSNYGTALAAWVVAQISGQSWEEYIESHILVPLNMSHTTLAQPVPPQFVDDLAQGYGFVGGRQQPRDFEFIPLAPVGAISASATDMARFMLAHLQLGTLEGVAILQEETARQMQTQHFAHAPGLPGMAHGFMEYSVESPRIFGHGGDTILFHTGLYLVPEFQTGVYIAYNGAESAPAREMFMREFGRRYFETMPIIEPTAPTTTARELAQFAGNYRSTRLAQTTPDKVAGLLMNIAVGSDDEGYLVVGGLGGLPTRWTEIGPGRFRHIEADGRLGRDTLVFEFDPVTQQPTALYLGPLSIMAFERIAWPESPIFQGLLFGGSLLVALIGLFAWPALLWRNRRRPGRKARLNQWAGAIGLASALLVLVYQIGLGVAFRDPMAVAFGLPPIFDFIGWLPLVLVVLVAGMVGFAVWQWIGGGGRIGNRIFYTAAALVFCGLMWQLWYWNFLLAPFILAG